MSEPLQDMESIIITTEDEYKSIGPLSASSKLKGIRYDLKCGQYLSFIKKAGKTQRIGCLYQTKELAAIAYDMQALKLYGSLADKFLNFNYLYKIDSDREKKLGSKVIMRLKHQSGVIVTIECDDDEADSLVSEKEKILLGPIKIISNMELAVEAEAVDSLICSPPGIRD
jgi:hypothetical protein